MLREYEFTVVAKADLPEGERAKFFEGYEAIMKRSGGEFLRRDDLGVKKLAYPIKKSFRGHYMYYDLASTPENIAECERLMRIDDNMLRYLVIKTADEVDVETRKAELAKQAAAAALSRSQSNDE